jgi:tetratricopeptide (TPR) repeat protein
MEDMERWMPESVRPISNPDLAIQVGRMYLDLGKPEELRKRLNEVTARPNLRSESKIRLAGYWATSFNDAAQADRLISSALGSNPTADQLFQAGRELYSAGANAMAAQYFEKTMDVDPDNPQAVGALLQLYESMGDKQKAQMMLEEWLTRHPSDRGAKQKLDQLRGIAVADTGAGRAAKQ